MSALPAHPRYRADIDGLRAVAVLCVLAYHAFPGLLPGGFVGVDIFFVISGYLISTIILGNLRQDRFSFLDFYVRRIRRIFPSLLVVLGACLAAGWLLLYADDYSSLGKHAAAGAGFASNLVLWDESGYFDDAAKLKPLLHLWSLGIEEQFYLAWPLTLWLAWRRQVRTQWLIGGIALLSLSICLWLSYSNDVAAFYSPLSRFWELLVGALLAERQLHHAQRARTGVLPTESPRTSLAANAMSVCGAALIVLAALLFDEADPFPGWRALLPTLGACLLIAAGHEGILNRRVLSLRAMRWIGLISYPLYLWHWPLLAYLNIQYPEGPAVSMRLAALGLSFLLAWLSYKLVETPLRFGGKTSAKTIGLLVGMAAIALAGVYIHAHRGFISRFPSVVSKYSNYEYDFRSDARIGTCWLNGKYSASGYSKECVDPAGSQLPLLLVWGDSHTGRFFPGLRNASKGRLRLAEFVRNACVPYFSTVSTSCLHNNEFILETVHDLHPDTVLLFAFWNHHDPDPQSVSTHLLVTIEKLREAGAGHIIIVGPAPQWQPALPKSLVRLYAIAAYDRPPRRTRFGLVETALTLDRHLQRELSGKADVTYLSAIDAMCTDAGCLTWIGSPDRLTTWDYGHLTTPAAAYLARRLDIVGRVSGGPGQP